MWLWAEMVCTKCESDRNKEGKVGQPGFEAGGRWTSHQAEEGHL